MAYDLRTDILEPLARAVGDVVPYTSTLDIRNMGAMAAGQGARYLECFRGHEGALIASHWRRKMPTSRKAGYVVVDFGK